MLHGVLNMPLPDDPAEMGAVEWVQFRDRAREASSRILELEADKAILVEALGEMWELFRGDPAGDDFDAYEVLDRARALLSKIDTGE